MRQQHHAQPQRPAACPRPQRVAGRPPAGRRVRRAERPVKRQRQQHPRDRQVRRRVPGRDVAEVDHAGHPAAAGEDIRRVQVAVQPHRRPLMPGRRERGLPQAQRCRPVDLAFRQPHVVEERAGALAHPVAAHRVSRRLVRGGSVQRAEEPADRVRRGGQVERFRVGGGSPREVGHHAPGPGVAEGRHAGPFGGGNRKGQAGRQYRQPPLLVTEDLCRGGAARQPRDQPVPDAEHDVVPPVRHERDRKGGEVGMLAGKQPTDEIRGHVDLGGGHRVGSH